MLLNRPECHQHLFSIALAEVIFVCQGLRTPAAIRETNEAGMWQAAADGDQDESSSSSDDGEFQVSFRTANCIVSSVLPTCTTKKGLANYH